MSTLAETSFLCALYREQSNSPQARGYYTAIKGPLEITAAVAFEFRQSVRLQVFLHSVDRTKGYKPREGDVVLEKFALHIRSGAISVVSCDWSEVFLIAERISSAWTVEGGHRSWDVIHVGSAVHLEAGTFLSFDERQRRLALANGLSVAPE